ncbi:MAG: transcriptional regulator [Proteobacteria bacterium]|nr:MAG: transcriptional regulator [Pseudomonadota bacterium]
MSFKGTEKHRVLVVDDEPDIRQLVSEILEDEGYQVVVAETAEQAREQVRVHRPELILLDIWMPGEDGISLLKGWYESGVLNCPVIMMSGHGTIETAVEATRLGAYDFIEKPLSMAKLLLSVGHALKSNQLEQENKGLKRQVLTPSEPIGSSQTMRDLRAQAERISQYTDVVVTLYGESGAGKEVFARYIHGRSDRANGPFVKVVASAHPAENFLEELFGKEKNGNITPGVFDEVQGGTLYLCDIASLDNAAQQALLMVLRDKQYTRVGGTTRIDFQVSVVVSAQHDLRDDVDAGQFSEELYFRINVVPLVIPPLREHPEDVPELLNFYVDRLIALDGLPYRHFSVAAQNHLRNYHWLGNIRELRNLVQRLLILGTDTEITQEEVEEVLGRSIPIFSQGIEKLPVSLFELPLRQAREQFEHDYLSYQLEQCGGNVSQLAERVQMERTHLYRKMRSLNIDPKQFNK